MTQGPGRNLDLGSLARVLASDAAVLEGAHKKNRPEARLDSEGDEADPVHTLLREQAGRDEPPLNQARTQIDFGDVSNRT